ncbi:MAG: carboxylesterase family protein [Dehalococcoidia bacterium]|nr:carboxylesterase family protein [Dehalococcoidia bacterium]
MALKKASILLVPLLLVALLLSTVGGCRQSTEEALSAWKGGVRVQTLYGKIEGKKSGDGSVFWKGIPYAKAPVGELRWKAPRDPDPWKETLKAYGFGSECTQCDYLGGMKGSEDCLYLNIWRPESEEDGLPVYFWIHGGGNSMGSASDQGYDGADLAIDCNMIVVSVNYRLGPLGWFTYPALRSSEPGAELDNSGNYGTLDLIKALEWVKDNIAAFGGDPDRVTVAGESAGAINILSLLISPLASGLFHGAIAQSGMPVALPVETGEQSARGIILKMLVTDGRAADKSAAEAYLDQMSDSEINAYLRSKTATQLLSAYEGTVFGMISFPFIFEDGTVIPEGGFDSLENGEYPNKVPVIIGSNKEETKIFLFMASLLSDNPFKNRDDLYEKVASVTSDLWKLRGVDDIARKLTSSAGQPPVYAYQFLWGAADASGTSVLPGEYGFKLGACHGIDVPFFFGNWEFFNVLSGAVFTAENRVGREALSEEMQAYVARFVRTGDPSPDGSGLADWQSWSNDLGGPKCILLNADLNTASARMSTVELTEAEVMARVDAEVRQVIDSFVGLLPFLVGEQI